MMKDTEKVALTPREVAHYYGFAIGTLANWRVQGKGPKYHKVEGSKILYFREDVELYIREYSVQTIDSWKASQ